ncbi:MAG: DUF1192 family protein [Alphaproteobacteria bacterium]
MDEISRKTADFTVGEDLYGISVAELRTRIGLLNAEVSRIEAELAKKQGELSAAEKLFGA